MNTYYHGINEGNEINDNLEYWSESKEYARNYGTITEKIIDIDLLNLYEIEFNLNGFNNIEELIENEIKKWYPELVNICNSIIENYSIVESWQIFETTEFKEWVKENGYDGVKAYENDFICLLLLKQRH